MVLADSVSRRGLGKVTTWDSAVAKTARSETRNVSSGASSIRGIPNRYVYGASKAAIIGLTKAVAADFVRKGIRANAICPGFIHTPILASMPDKVVKMMEDRVPLGRLGQPEEIANTYAWLASDEASYINGAVIEVSGGATI